MSEKKFQTTRREKKEDSHQRVERSGRTYFTRRAIRAIAVLVVAIVSILSSVNLGGEVGEFLVSVYTLLFGKAYVVVLLGLLGLGIVYARFQKTSILSSQYLGMLLGLLGLFGFIHLFVPLSLATHIDASGKGGGYVGLLLGLPLRKIFGDIAAGVILIGATGAGLVLIFGPSLLVVKKILAVKKLFSFLWQKLRTSLKTPLEGTSAYRELEIDEELEGAVFVRKEIEGEEGKRGEEKPLAGEAQKGYQEALLPGSTRKRYWKKVDLPLELLTARQEKPTSGDIAEKQEIIQKTLANFGIEVEMGEVSVGPTVTQYTLRPAEGVKLSQITTLANDIALAVASHPIRIEAPIPGKSLVGIEVPNQKVAVVALKEVLSSEEFTRRRSNLAIALGKDVAGNPWIADLGAMPHLLIAGATGSGKSVMINSLIISLLYQNQPDDLKLILIDPKRVEMTSYNDVPHLLCPVIIEIDKTINALKWVVGEMDRRFRELAHAGKRNIEVYNLGKIEKMPYLVVVIDELADLMSVAAGEVEAAIIRLAQMARAVGIHLVVATQRPSVDIITGLIKANITSRIAFSVASIVDSRTILDTGGAEKLLGRGDMLYLSAALSKPKRLQGVYVTDEEIERVTGYLKESWGEPEYEEEVVEKIEEGYGGIFGESQFEDSLLPSARELVIQTQQASASFLQRRLAVGYSRAARLLDLLEREGVIGPPDGSKPRKVLVSRGTEVAAEEELREGENNQFPPSLEAEDEEKEEPDSSNHLL